MGKFYIVLCLLFLRQAFNGAAAFQRTRLTPVRTGYSAQSAGTGTPWPSREGGQFRKHGLDSTLVYIRGGNAAVQKILAREIQFGHLSSTPPSIAGLCQPC